MSHLRLYFMLTLLLSLPAAAFAASPSSVLAAMCQAEGGVHWHGVAAIVATGSVVHGGLTGNEHAIVDLRDGRQRLQKHYQVYADGSGIDAHGAWEQDDSGQVHPLDSPEAEVLAITDRWLAQRGYCNLPRLPAKLQPLSAVTQHGITYARMDVTPPNGRVVALWIDPHHHLARTVELRSFQMVTTRFADYRNVQGVELPFRISTGVGNPKQAAVETIHHYRLLTHVPANALQRPGNAITDAQIADGKTRTIVPFTYGNGHLLVDARIDGKGPFPFILDTGGHAILTPATAKRLGLKTHGAGRGYGAGGGSIAISYTRVGKLRIGDASIDNQSFLVIPMSDAATDLGKQPPIAGVLGLEVFERFAVTLDFADKKMTLQTFASATPPPDAHVLPIRFTADMPLVVATLDGQRGIFGVDTGNLGPLMLFPQWAARHGLSRYYLAGVPAPSGGEGGMFMAHAAWIRSLQIAGVDVPADEPGLLTPKGAGATSNPSEAGNLGLPVWKHFRVEFDYRRGVMYLTSRVHFTLPQMASSAGFGAIKLDHAAFTVLKLTPNGPAAKAGLKPGNKIVSVNGKPASQLPSMWLVLHMGHDKPGTHMHLVCADGRKIDVVLGSNVAMLKALHPTVH